MASAPLSERSLEVKQDRGERLRQPRAHLCCAAPVVDAAQGMLTRPPPAAPPWSDGCGSCHSLERCASAQNERTGANSSSSLRTSCPWTRSWSRNATSAGSNRPFWGCPCCASSAPALTLHRVRGNVGLLTAQRAIDGARAPPLILCAADNEHRPVPAQRSPPFCETTSPPRGTHSQRACER